VDEGEIREMAHAGMSAWAEATPRPRAFTPLALGNPAFRRLFQSSDHGMVIFDDNRRYLAVNEAAARFFGLPADQIVGRRADDFTAPELLPVLPVMWAELLEAGTLAGPYEIVVRSRRKTLDFAATANIAPGRHLAIILSLAPGEEPEPTARPDAEPSSPVLTKRESEVLARLAGGMSAEEAASGLGVARNTIQNHLRSARAKLGARTRAHAIALAIARGEIPLEPHD
jgi:PAS domain S-box-containing protein